MSTITDPRTYQILQDVEGFYLATECGWDLTPKRRFSSYKDAEEELTNWIGEDEEARAQESLP